jgi:membrane protein DedA with SNARE-associated domain
MDNLLALFQTISPVAIYIAIFLWLTGESTGIPLPNETVLLLTGSLAAQGKLFAPLLVMVAVAGSTTGSLIAYTIGWKGGRPLVLRLGRLIRLHETKLAQAEDWFARWGDRAIFISRMTPFVRTVASFPAGISQMPLRRFIIAVIAGSTIWCTFFVYLGVALGKNWRIALSLLNHYTVPALLVLALLIAGYLYLHHWLKQAPTATTPPPPEPAETRELETETQQ